MRSASLPELKGEGAVRQSDRQARRILNQMAQRLTNRHYVVVRAQLAAQLNAAELRGQDAELLRNWQCQVESRSHAGADV